MPFVSSSTCRCAFRNGGTRFSSYFLVFLLESFRRFNKIESEHSLSSVCPSVYVLRTLAVANNAFFSKVLYQSV